MLGQRGLAPNPGTARPGPVGRSREELLVRSPGLGQQHQVALPGAVGVGVAPALVGRVPHLALQHFVHAYRPRPRPTTTTTIRIAARPQEDAVGFDVIVAETGSVPPAKLAAAAVSPSSVPAPYLSSNIRQLCFFVTPRLV